MAKHLMTLAILALSLGSSCPAGAAVNVYFGIDQGSGNPPTTPVNSAAARNSFQAVLNGIGVESFESQTTGAGNFPAALTFTGTAVTATASTTNSAINYVTTGTTNGTFATTGTKYVFNDGTGGINDTVAFGTGVGGLGLYFTDLADNSATIDQMQYVLTFSDNTTQTVTTTLAAQTTNANVLFFGVVSTNPAQTITKVQILNTLPGNGDSIGFDDLTIGRAVVPEPTSIALSGAGLLGLLVGLRYRGRKSARAI